MSCLLNFLYFCLDNMLYLKQIRIYEFDSFDFMNSNNKV